MRLTLHSGPACEPWEYWCAICGTMNLSLTPLTVCPVCNTEITTKGKPGALDLDALRSKFEKGD